MLHGKWLGPFLNQMGLYIDKRRKFIIFYFSNSLLAPLEIPYNEGMDDFLKVDKPVNHFEDLCQLVKELKASDLHIQVGSPPILRIAGIPKRTDLPAVTSEVLEGWVRDILSPEQYQTLTEKKNFDHGYSISNQGRMRINLFFQRGHLSLAARFVQTYIPTLEELYLPQVLQNIAELHDGLVIVAGVTGSGKSTSLASMIEYINQTKACHILTIEDPIEYLYKNKKAFINQREVGMDTPSFHDGLKYALREDPDIMMIGEMRDSETVEFGLSAAETGHLVFATIHSGSAPQTIGRMIDLFPPDQHFQIRQSLQFNLRAVVSQKLLPSIKEGVPRVPSVEVMIIDPTIRELIKKGEDIKIHNAIRAGAGIGMQDFNRSLLDLVKNEMISEEVALRVSPNAETLRMNLRGIFLDDEKAIF